METEKLRQEIMPDTMKVEEFARLLGIGRNTAYQLARENRLPVPVIRLGRRMVISRRAYEALISAQHVPAETASEGRTACEPETRDALQKSPLERTSGER